MNIAAGIINNTRATVSREAGTRGKEASEPSGEGSQQRFADVLPLVQAALEQPQEKSPPTGKAPARGRLAGAKTTGDLPVRKDRPTPQRSENAVADPQVPAWSFAGVVQPAAPRQAHVASANVQPAKPAKDQKSVEPMAFDRGPKAAEKTPASASAAREAPDTRSNPIRGQHVPQAETVAREPNAGVQAAANVVQKAATSKGPQTALPAEVAGRQVPAVSRPAQETTTAPVPQIAQTVARGTRAEPADTRNERAQSSRDVRIVSPAPQAGRQETPVAVKAAPGVQPTSVKEKPEQTAAKSRPENSRPENSRPTDGPATSPRPTKDLQGQALPVEQRQEKASKPPAVKSEISKAEAAPTEAKDPSSPGAKATGPAMPDMRVVPTADAAVSSQRPAVQAQSQTSVDAPAVRGPVQSVGEQILDSVHAAAVRGDRQVLVRLNPPELGTILVRFQEQGNSLSGSLEVASAEVRRELEQALPQVVRALQEAGVQIRRVEIVASDQPERELGGEHQPQDVWQQRQGTGQDRGHSQGTPQVRWPQAAGGQGVIRPGDVEDEPRTAASGRIDVLL